MPKVSMIVPVYRAEAYLAVYQAGKVGVTRDVLYAYYQNPVGIMQSKWTPKKLDILEAEENQIVFARERGNPRLLEKAYRQYLYSSGAQIGFAKRWEDPEKGRLVRTLRKKLRKALRQGKEFGVDTRSWSYFWVYEEAYPMKPFWWLLGKLHRKGE